VTGALRRDFAIIVGYVLLGLAVGGTALRRRTS
jgi:hypothetical protein